LNVDNAESAHGQSDVLLDQEAIIIGATVRYLLVHRRKRVAAYLRGSIRMEDATDSAHV
jgi:hypothetical protein